MTRVILLSLLISISVWADDDDELVNMIEKNEPGVVNIQTTTLVRSYQAYGPLYDQYFSDFFGMRPQTRRQSALGSGFVYDAAQGIVVTNNHVVKGADKIVVVFNDGRQFKAKLVGTDPIVDLGVLRLEGKLEKLKALDMGDSDKVKKGMSVIAMGNPFGLSGSITRGIISSLHRSIGQGPYDDFLQTDASINFGNSGGPLFNKKGEVIGINTAIRADGQGIGFAIPINMAKKLVPEIVKNGRVIRSWIGIVGENNMPAFQYRFGITAEKGVVVYTTIERHNGMRAGLKAGDVITHVDKERVKDIYDLQREVQSRKPGEKVTLGVIRGSKNLKITTEVEELPPQDQLPEGYNFM